MSRVRRGDDGRAGGAPVSGRRTKVVATLGPASSEPAQVAALVAAGADVLRLNCSHLTTARMVEALRTVREVAPTTAVLVDVQGPKMRYAGSPLVAAEGEEHVLGWRELGFDGPDALAHVGEGDRVLVHDGKVELRSPSPTCASASGPRGTACSCTTGKSSCGSRPPTAGPARCACGWCAPVR